MEWLTPAEAAAAELDDTDRLAGVRLAQAGALYIHGQFGAAPPRLEQLREMADAGDDPLLRAQSDNLLGRRLVIRGELSRGQAALERALAAAARGEALSEAHGFLLEAAMCARVRGEACTAFGAWEEAAEWARAEAALGRLERTRGEPALAGRHLDAAAARFVATGMARDLARTRGAAPESGQARPDRRAAAS